MTLRGTFSVLVLSLAAAAPAVEAQDSKVILGMWTGTSLCTNREATPGCKDEEVVYEFRETSPPAAGKLTLSADKVIHGERQPMGDLDFVWDAKANVWACDIQKTTRYHGLWTFPPPKGGELTGTLVLLPEKTVVRKVAARRTKTSG